jgi:hypothetical protein
MIGLKDVEFVWNLFGISDDVFCWKEWLEDPMREIVAEKGAAAEIVAEKEAVAAGQSC